jgi:hypothetical protein
MAHSSGSPCFARGTVHGALVRFPLQAGGTCRRGLSNARVLVKFGLAIGIRYHPKRWVRLSRLKPSWSRLIMDNDL